MERLRQSIYLIGRTFDLKGFRDIDTIFSYHNVFLFRDVGSQPELRDTRNQEGENLLPNITVDGFTQYHSGILLMALILTESSPVRTDTGHAC